MFALYIRLVYVIAKNVESFCDEVLWGTHLYNCVLPAIHTKPTPHNRTVHYIRKFLLFTEHFQAQAVNLIVKIVLWHWCVCVGCGFKTPFARRTSISKLILRRYGNLHR